MIACGEACSVQCHHEGCDCNHTVLCGLYNMDTDEQLHFYYCEKHCPTHGFCYSCGEFWGGIESFDFNNSTGLCEHCLEMLKIAMGEYDDEDNTYPGVSL